MPDNSNNSQVLLLYFSPNDFRGDCILLSFRQDQNSVFKCTEQGTKDVNPVEIQEPCLGVSSTVSFWCGMSGGLCVLECL